MPVWWVYWFTRAARTKCHGPGSSNNRKVLTHSSGGGAPEIKVSAGWSLLRAVREGWFLTSVLSLQVAVSSLCRFTSPPLSEGVCPNITCL